MPTSSSQSSDLLWYKVCQLRSTLFMSSDPQLRHFPAVIVLRICYVYSKDAIIRAFVVGCFVACTIITFVIYGKIWHDVDSFANPVPSLKIDGCTAPPSRQIWKMFLPNLGLHTLLYLATTIPMLRMRRVGKQSRMLNRLARE